MSDNVKIGRFLSLVLRHNPAAAGVSLDEHGWAKVDALIAGVKRRWRDFDMAKLEEIVATNNKNRYSFNDDKTKIRANQGHSVNVDVELQECEPPAVLYHGTGEKSVAAIWREGLKPQSRLYVHLSPDSETARKVGIRHGKPALFLVDCKAMREEGFVFFKSVNGVWLTKEVPAKYLSSGEF